MVQFLNWALSVGRLLIILVEFLALGTFLYRFTIDWQIVDLKDKIKNQRAIVSSFQTQEDNFRNLQSRLEYIKKYNAVAMDDPKLLGDIIEMGRGYITFSSIFISNNKVRIEAEASSVSPLTAFVDQLKEYPQIQNISIDKVENKTSNAEIIVGLSADIKRDATSEIQSSDIQVQPFAEEKLEQKDK